MKFASVLTAALVATVASGQEFFKLENEKETSIKEYLIEADQKIKEVIDLLSKTDKDKYGSIMENNWKEAVEKNYELIADTTNREMFEAIKFIHDNFDSTEKIKPLVDKIFGVEDDELDPKIDSISSFSHDEIIKLEQFDKHSVRIKKTYPKALDLDTVDQYTGYLDVEDEDKHFFFWFFESRNDPKNDPVILWLNGGPGCASEGGLLFELGPSFINATLQPVFNPYSWNTNASVIFLDQPVGAGYSYAGNPTVSTSARAAVDVYAFLELFFKKFPHFLSNEFHISGESYAGHYIPAIGAEILDHPERSFNLTSLLIGNGFVDFPIQELESPKMLCGEGGMDPIFDEDQCKITNDNIVPAVAFSYICTVTLNPLVCGIANYYGNLTFGPLEDLHLNPYDLRRKCEDDYLCYKGINYVSDYLALKSVREAIGVNTDFNYLFCNSQVGMRFTNSRDHAIPYESKIAKILDAKVPILLYAGDKDFVCHWLGYNEVSNHVEFEGYQEYRDSEFVPWMNDGKEVGQVRGANGLTFLRVYESGHMVPHDQPKVAYDMLSTWLAKDYYFAT